MSNDKLFKISKGRMFFVKIVNDAYRSLLHFFAIYFICFINSLGMRVLSWNALSARTISQMPTAKYGKDI
jgi:hypothetical protein